MTIEGSLFGGVGLRARAHEQREIYHYAWLGELWKHAQDGSAESFMVRGRDECLGVLDRLEAVATGLAASSLSSLE
jgi:hypothetical protein